VESEKQWSDVCVHNAVLDSSRPLSEWDQPRQTNERDHSVCFRQRSNYWWFGQIG